MARREIQPFNLSLLDLLTSALGSVIFLFIITPKGGQTVAQAQQVGVYLDTAKNQVFGLIPDSVAGKQIGDTLRVVFVDYKDFPEEKTGRKAETVFQPRPVPRPERNPEEPRPEAKPKEPETPKPQQAPPVAAQPQEEKPAPRPAYKGIEPSVPALLSFEVKWADPADNVDLYVCKGNSCVYGGRKRDYAIGQWDSGKSRNRLFGNDLRTNLEAVRQFDKILPGEYTLYAQFKNSDKNHDSVLLTGLVYSKGPDGQERGESFSKSMTKTRDRVLIGRVVVREDGSFNFIRA